ncbi:hypothetical protein [Pseudomonas aeruginosa]|uniref:hypothetical protein n=1 Tax=Pseudomonas aeruginosa TaxID=287 RepID=UPI001EE2BA1F|nr:hypothetical protein [Pseudomonas aeruginosa]
MADLTTTATAGAIMGLGLGVTLPVDGGMLFGALLGAWLATGTKQDLKAWSRLLSLILPTCVGYLFADVALQGTADGEPMGLTTLQGTTPHG